MSEKQVPALIAESAKEITALANIAPKQASARFEIIANTLSDQQLQQVIAEIELPTLTQITTQHDLSYPSILTELMSAEQIGKVLKQQPLYWESRLKNDLAELTRFTFDFITYVLRSQPTDARQIDIIETLLDDESGLRYLSLPFVVHVLSRQAYGEDEEEGDSPYRTYEEEDLEEADEYCRRSEFEDMLERGWDTPSSLFMLITHLVPEAEVAIRELLLELNYGLDAQRLVKKLADELVMLAKEANQPHLEHELHELDAMFSFLD